MARSLIFPDNAQSDCLFWIPQNLLCNAEVSYLRVWVVSVELPNNKSDIWPRPVSQVHQLSDQLLVYYEICLHVVSGFIQKKSWTGFHWKDYWMAQTYSFIFQQVADVIFLINLEGFSLMVFVLTRSFILNSFMSRSLSYSSPFWLWDPSKKSST